MLIDLFPPGSFDPSGIHGAVWDKYGEQPYEPPADKRLTLASYSAGDIKSAYVQPISVGDAQPDMPLFLSRNGTSIAPLERTYMEAYEGVPRALARGAGSVTMEEKWPFDQPPNCAVITVWPILNGEVPILRVSHDADDHGWQFLTGETVSESDAAVVALREMVAHDATILEVADLPPGWLAWRTAIGEPWIRERQSE